MGNAENTMSRGLGKMQRLILASLKPAKQAHVEGKIGGEQINFRRFVVSERRGGYKADRITIRMEPDDAALAPSWSMIAIWLSRPACAA